MIANMMSSRTYRDIECCCCGAIDKIVAPT